MILEVALLGGALYAGAKAYTRQRKKEQFGALLAPRDRPSRPAAPATNPIRAGLEEFHRTHVAPRVAEAVATVQNRRAPILAQDARRQQLAHLLGKDAAPNEQEQEASRHLTIAVAALSISGTATLFGLSLGFASAPLLIYLYMPVLKGSYQAFQTGEYRWLRSFEALVIGIELLGGYFFASALASTLYFAAERARFKVEDQARKSLITIFDQQPRSAWVLVDGYERNIALSEIQVGDIVVVNAGEMIPVDGTIIAGGASIDQHMLTGEAQPVEKQQDDQVLASTMVLAGRVTIRVERAGNDTTAAQISTILNHTVAFREKIELQSISLVERFIPFTLLLGAVSLPFVGASRALAVMSSSFGYNFRLSGPISLLNFLQIAASNGILIKDGRALEQLPKIDTIVFDKTGTLTHEQPHVGAIHTYDGIAEDQVLAWAAAAEYRQTHPIAQAILQAAQERNLLLDAIEDAQYKVGYGLQVRLQGRTVRVGSSRFLTMEQITLPPAAWQLQEDCHELGYSLVLVAVDDGLVGAIELHPTPRPEAREIVRRLQQRNLKLYIISGDHWEPTRRLAHSVGIDYYFAEVLPQDKAMLVEQLQCDGRTVCFVGDGINDAIALQQADLSISLRGASTIATDTAQVILMESSLRGLADLLDLGDEFKASMRSNMLLATMPSAICMGGVYLLKWGLVTAIMMYNAGLAASMGNAFLPLLLHHLTGKNPSPVLHTLEAPAAEQGRLAPGNTDAPTRWDVLPLQTTETAPALYVEGKDGGITTYV